MESRGNDSSEGCAGSKETVLVLHQQVNEAVEPSPCILSSI
ncbi:hypothetical protein QYG89_00010 [Bacillus sp. B190/17]|uniref:Uncharacterized protein n=1 Tax=Bacillus lumedeiriae TaxID=3058829 RepID=A0ABW8I4G7_9BACI